MVHSHSLFAHLFAFFFPKLSSHITFQQHLPELDCSLWTLLSPNQKLFRFLCWNLTIVFVPLSHDLWTVEVHRVHNIQSARRSCLCVNIFMKMCCLLCPWPFQFSTYQLLPYRREIRPKRKPLAIDSIPCMSCFTVRLREVEVITE